MAKDSIPFTDIERVSDLPIKEPQYLESVRTLQVGFGSKVLRADERGIWLGGEDPTTAPFSVDMDGNYYDSFDDNSSIVSYNSVSWNDCSRQYISGILLPQVI